MEEQFSRTAMLLGEKAVERLRRSRVAVFGIGGVGGYAVEALARSGVGTLDLIDADTVAPSNLNRQIIALHSTLGQRKVDAAAQRIHDICPQTAVHAHELFFMPETADQLDFSQFDYVIDAIDTVKGKLEIIQRAEAAGVPVISAMGAGNKLDPTKLQVADIYSTKVCPLARVMRYELRKRGVKRLKVVYSEELPVIPRSPEVNGGKPVPGSVMFVPAAAGLILAGEVVRGLVKNAE
ncbi:MAG: tRNA threonylcarbamoyladenosine dehydratase [Oscillospiraceae bacterium]|nr:tRNA threonylcarbamoyladenosine dehydratase [Oscillospiraceae bacterium]MCR5305287.1 tRNA threonylcarbamoyladenosine dehydratase [Oscillospiraceae bacterium]